ncbi:MAG: gamma carbonic anhydrase family protein [Chitinivibrionales bacterium]|nr:gamma carbonic anhydrase family protein [Chitinivibrionales bacterium]
MLKNIPDPKINSDTWIAPNAVVMGNVAIARGASVWYGCIIRGDEPGEAISIGEDTNIQDGSIVHIDKNTSCRIGARVTVGHRAIIHAATVADDCLIGMGAMVLTGASVGSGSIVAAGAVVTEGMQVPENSLVAGVPAKVKRTTTDDDRKRIEESWKAYIWMTGLHRDKQQR